MPDLGPFAIAGLSTGAVYVLAGVGLVVLYRASGVLNLAQGALGALSALLAWQIADSGFPQWLGWMAAVAASTASARAQRSDRARGGDARLRADYSGLLRIHLGRMAAQLAPADRHRELRTS